MVRRAVKTRARRIFQIIFFFVACIVLVIILFVILGKFLPFLSSDSSGTSKLSKNIVAPISPKTSLEQLKKDLADKNINVDSIKHASDSATIIVELEDGPEIFFSEDIESNWQVDSVVLILQHLSVNNKLPSVIDLRSRRPIVKF